MTKVIIFGLWETMGTKHFSASKILREQFNIENSSDFLPKYEKSLHLEKWNNPEKMAKSFLGTFNIPITKTNVDFMVRTILKGVDTATLFEGMKEILKKLKRSYRLVILSNITNYKSKVVRKWGIEKFFDKQIYPWKIKSLKPSKKSFDKICNRLNVRPNECVFIDNEERSL